MLLVAAMSFMETMRATSRSIWTIHIGSSSAPRQIKPENRMGVWTGAK